jgi:hypothetical protein
MGYEFSRDYFLDNMHALMLEIAFQVAVNIASCNTALSI